MSYKKLARIHSKCVPIIECISVSHSWFCSKSSSLLCKSHG